MYYMIGLMDTWNDQIRAVRAWERPYEDISSKLFYYYKKRTLVLPLILGGDIERLDQTFLTTEYNKLNGSKFYTCADQLFADNRDVRIAYVINSYNDWYYSIGDPKVWEKL